MMSKDTVILNKILEYCRQVDEACEMFGNDFTLFQEKSVFQNACCMCILQIGELCKVISDDLKEKQPGIPWKAWCGIRDIFAHQYDNLNLEIAWNTIQRDLPELKVECERMLNEENAAKIVEVYDYEWTDDEL